MRTRIKIRRSRTFSSRGVLGTAGFFSEALRLIVEQLRKIGGRVHLMKENADHILEVGHSGRVPWSLDDQVDGRDLSGDIPDRSEGLIQSNQVTIRNRCTRPSLLMRNRQQLWGGQSSSSISTDDLGISKEGGFENPGCAGSGRNPRRGGKGKRSTKHGV